MLINLRKYIGTLGNSKSISFFKNTDDMKVENLINLDRYAEIGKLSTGILHDILNPLSSLLISLGNFKINKSKKDIDEYLELITASGKQMEELIYLVKTYTNDRKNQSDFDINEIIRNVLILMKCYSIKSGVQINFLSSKSINIKGDSLGVYQIIINLISNAIESYRKTESQNKKIIIETDSDNNFIYISIRDFGKGIDNRKINKIFKPFYSTKKSSGGSGIGLATVKHVVEDKLKGEIKVKSELGKGSIFLIKIPKSS